MDIKKEFNDTSHFQVLMHRKRNSSKDINFRMKRPPSRKSVKYEMTDFVPVQNFKVGIFLFMLRSLGRGEVRIVFCFFDQRPERQKSDI